MSFVGGRSSSHRHAVAWVLAATVAVALALSSRDARADTPPRLLSSPDVSAPAVSGEVDEVHGSTVDQGGSLPKAVQGMTAVWTSASGVCAIGGSTTLPNDYAKPLATVAC